MVFEIPLMPNPTRFAISLGGTVYTLCFQFRNPSSFDGREGDWVMDVADELGQPLVCGIPLVTGANLWEQYGYLNFPGELWVLSDGNEDAVPTYLGLGITSHLYLVTAPDE